MIKSKVETVTTVRVKPAHIEGKPENDYTKQHKATTTSKPTAFKPSAKTSVPRTAGVGARSTTTPKPSRIGVDTEKNWHARSTIQTKGNDSSDRSAIQHDRGTVARAASTPQGTACQGGHSLFR